MELALSTVFLTALLGSPHCGAMCGPLLTIVAPPSSASPAGARRFFAWWQVGRLAAYLALGALAGLVGGAANAAGRLVGMQRAALVLAGIVLVAGGALSLWSAFGGRGVGAVAVHGPFVRVLRAIRGGAGAARSFQIGALTALLPCGWLWAFVTVAAGSGSVARGSLVLATFWLGTLPMLVGVLAGARRLLAARPKFARVAVALVLVLSGALAISGRSRLAFAEPPAPSPPPAPVAAPGSLDPALAPCCGHGS